MDILILGFEKNYNWSLDRAKEYLKERKYENITMRKETHFYYIFYVEIKGHHYHDIVGSIYQIFCNATGIDESDIIEAKLRRRNHFDRTENMFR